MHAIQIKAPGKIEYISCDSTPLKKGEVRIEVAVAAVCGSDIKNIQNPQQLPMIPGHEFSGRVVEIGEDVNEVLKIGDRVTIFPMISCMDCEACNEKRFRDCEKKIGVGFNRSGAFATEVNIDSRFVIPISDDITFEQGALLEHLCCGYRLTQEIINSNKSNGSQILIIGDGPIALADLQFLKNANYNHIFVIGKRKSRLEIFLEMGAEKVFDIDELDALKSLSFDICIFAAPADSVLSEILSSFKSDAIIYPQTRIRDNSIMDYIKHNGLVLGRAFAYYFEDFKVVMDLILNKQIKTDELISKKISLKEYVDSYSINPMEKERAKTLIFNEQFR